VISLTHLILTAAESSRPYLHTGDEKRCHNFALKKNSLTALHKIKEKRLSLLQGENAHTLKPVFNYKRIKW
jgi:hypothetical protein